jgi:hypothetical protein
MYKKVTVGYLMNALEGLRKTTRNLGQVGQFSYETEVSQITNRSANHYTEIFQFNLTMSVANIMYAEREMLQFSRMEISEEYWTDWQQPIFVY